MGYSPAFLRWLRGPLPPRKGERALDKESGGVPGVVSDFLDALGPILSLAIQGTHRSPLANSAQPSDSGRNTDSPQEQPCIQHGFCVPHPGPTIPHQTPETKDQDLDSWSATPWWCGLGQVIVPF